MTGTAKESSIRKSSHVTEVLQMGGVLLFASEILRKSVSLRKPRYPAFITIIIFPESRFSPPWHWFRSFFLRVGSGGIQFGTLESSAHWMLAASISHSFNILKYPWIPPLISSKGKLSLFENTKEPCILTSFNKTSPAQKPHFSLETFREQQRQ